MTVCCVFPWLSAFSELLTSELESVKSSKLFLFSVKNELLKSLKCLVFILMQDTEGYTLFNP